VICCRGKAEEALGMMRNMMWKLKLTVNDSKTWVCKLPEEKFDFLGYTFGRCYSPKTGRAHLGTKPSKKTGATHLQGDQPGNRTEQDPAGPRNNNHDTQSNDDWVGELFLFGTSQ
jgi:hypothetical protein